MKRLIAAMILYASGIVTFVASTSHLAGPAGASSSPYPAVLKVQRGLAMSKFTRALPWGSTLSAAESQWVRIRSTGLAYRWGVWKKDGGPSEFPVRNVYPVNSLDSGSHWTAAGPQLATDWAGGSIYYITRVIPVSPSAVVMVSNAVIDVTVDAGRHWYQYVNGYDNWSITGHTVTGGGIEIRVGPASYATLPKASYAIYALDLVHLQWRKIAQSLS